MFMNKLMGVVLCGGKSRRMGQDKGLIERDGVSWAVRVGQKLGLFGLPVLYSIRAGQEGAYSAVLPEAYFVTDALDLGGPLNGLFSVHRRFVDRDLLLLACDMQDMDEETIGELIEVYRKGGEEFYAYFDGEYAQPFCAIYTRFGLEKAFGELGQERSLRSVIGKGMVKRLDIRRAQAFENYNSL
jgi:molybdopterin-guanine dinucleotide biosynthesis protein A